MCAGVCATGKVFAVIVFRAAVVAQPSRLDEEEKLEGKSPSVQLTVILSHQNKRIKDIHGDHS